MVTRSLVSYVIAPYGRKDCGALNGHQIIGELRSVSCPNII